MTKYCFIQSWERPLYLWPTLDSLFHHTQKELKFVIMDNNSQDPLVHQIIAGFERRGMFEDVLLFKDNNPQRMNDVFKDYRSKIDEFFYFCENDVIVPSNICWATNYEEIYRAHEKVGMIGSTCELYDFPSVEQVMAAFPDMEGRERIFYTKENVPEMRIETLDTSKLGEKSILKNPPGRLVLIDAAALDQTGYQTDFALATKMQEIGYDWLISTGFRHRHIALAQAFDYPPDQNAFYQKTRDQYFRDLSPVTMRQRARRLVKKARRAIGM